MINFWRKNKEVLNYLVFGVLTTLVNLIVYFILTTIFPHTSTLILNVFAWFISVLFAFITNRTLVFESKAQGFSEIGKEMFNFFLGRIGTLIIEEIILWLGMILHFNDGIVKLAAQVIVIVLNYLISKFYIFKSKEN
jgi:putative flippase GtrA